MRISLQYLDPDLVRHELKEYALYCHHVVLRSQQFWNEQYDSKSQEFDVEPYNRLTKPGVAQRIINDLRRQAIKEIPETIVTPNFYRDDVLYYRRKRAYLEAEIKRDRAKPNPVSFHAHTAKKEEQPVSEEVNTRRLV